MAASAISIGSELISAVAPVIGALFSSPKHQLETQQTEAQERAQFAGAIAVYYAYAGNAAGVQGQLAALQDYLNAGQMPASTVYPGWGAYFNVNTNQGYDIPNPWPAGVDPNLVAEAKAAVDTGPMSFQQVVDIAQQVLANTPAGGPSLPASASASLTAPLSTSGLFSGGSSWLIYAAIGLVVLLLLVRK